MFNSQIISCENNNHFFFSSLRVDVAASLLMDWRIFWGGGANNRCSVTFTSLKFRGRWSASSTAKDSRKALLLVPLVCSRSSGWSSDYPNEYPLRQPPIFPSRLMICNSWVDPLTITLIFSRIFHPPVYGHIFVSAASCRKSCDFVPPPPKKNEVSFIKIQSFGELSSQLHVRTSNEIWKLFSPFSNESNWPFNCRNVSNISKTIGPACCLNWINNL